MKCKKSIMGLAALLIVIFHFYIPFTGTKLELTLWRATYIGVDLFFFVSAYSLGQREKISYLKFVGNRLLSIYVPFVVFAAVANFYEKWKYPRFFKVISGAEFFKRGGGSFLWFFVAIMLIYFIAPLLVKLKNRFKWKAFAGMMLGWIILSLIFQYVFHNRSIFILLNRLPIFFIGMYYGEIRKLPLKRFKLPVILIGLVVGGFLINKYGSLRPLHKPLQDMYYVIAIPFIVSFVALWDFISSRVKIRNMPLQFIGRFTLELYALQMIFGYNMEIKILNSTKKMLPSFLITALCLILEAYILYLAKTLFTKLILKLKEKKQS